MAAAVPLEMKAELSFCGKRRGPPVGGENKFLSSENAWFIIFPCETCALKFEADRSDTDTVY